MASPPAIARTAMATRIRVSRAVPTPYLGKIYFPSYGKIQTAIPGSRFADSLAPQRPSLNPPCPTILQLTNPPYAGLSKITPSGHRQPRRAFAYPDMLAAIRHRQGGTHEVGAGSALSGAGCLGARRQGAPSRRQRAGSLWRGGRPGARGDEDPQPQRGPTAAVGAPGGERSWLRPGPAAATPLIPVALSGHRFGPRAPGQG